MARHLARGALALGVLLTCCGATGPDFHRLEFRENRTSAEGIVVELADPDNPDHPTAWLGPLRIASRCTAELSLITAVYASKGTRYLVVLTYSGSLRYAHFVDLKSCRELWPPQKATRDMTVAGDDLAAGAGSHWQLFPDQPPKRR